MTAEPSGALRFGAMPTRNEREQLVAPSRVVAAVFGAILLSSALTSCSSGTDAPRRRGPDVTACAVEPDVPLVYLDRNGEPTGFAFELMRDIVDRHQGTLRLDRVSASRVVFRLVDGRCDVIISAVTDDSPDLESIDATDAYVDADFALAVRGTDTAAFPTVASLAGRSIGCVAGSRAEAWLRSVVPAGSTIATFPAGGDAFAALRSKSIDGVVTSRVAAAHRSRSDTDVRVTEVIATERSYVFGVRPGDRQTRGLIDDGLDQLGKDGTLAELRQRWFGDQLG